MGYKHINTLKQLNTSVSVAEERVGEQNKMNNDNKNNVQKTDKENTQVR
jgi:hypothetical protein